MQVADVQSRYIMRYASTDIKYATRFEHQRSRQNKTKLQLLVKGAQQRQAKAKFPTGNYMFKVDNRNTRARCEICSK